MGRLKSGQAPYVSLEDFFRVLNACSGFHRQRNRTVLLISHKLGLRAKEIAALTVGDLFDLEQEGKVRNEIRLLAKYTKGAKYRELPVVNPQLRQSLADYYQERLHRRWATHDHAPLFISQKGGHFSPNSMQYLIGDLYKKIGITASSHSGRRSFATHFLQAGGNIFDLMVLMGHANISTTQLYQTTSIERLRSELARLP